MKPTKKRLAETIDVHIEIEKGRKRRKNIYIQTKKNTSKRTAHKGNTQTCRLARKQRGGGVARRQKNRIRHQGEQGSEKKKSEKGDTRKTNDNGKRKTTKRKGRGKPGTCVYDVLAVQRTVSVLMAKLVHGISLAHKDGWVAHGAAMRQPGQHHVIL